jgi:hypothetical protein
MLHVQVVDFAKDFAKIGRIAHLLHLQVESFGRGERKIGLQVECRLGRGQKNRTK